MTFCLAMKVDEGLVCIADTRITTGQECISVKKVSVFQGNRQSLFIMTSGLRSVRDKALTYFEELMDQTEEPFDRVFKAVNAFAEMVRRVSSEDKAALAASGFSFNMHTLIGGQLSGDKEHKVYLLYPQGNWVEIVEGTPYCIIGASGYGKPIMDRTLKYNDSLQFALKVGCLAFDSTRISASDVGFPVDIVLYRRDSFKLAEYRLEENDLHDVSHWWQERLRDSVNELPAHSLSKLYDRFTNDTQI